MTSEPPASGDPLAPWRALGDEVRRSITAAIQRDVVAEARRLAGHWYPSDPRQGPRIEVIGAARDGARYTVQFIADQFIYCTTISGSDWAYHYLFTGDVAHVEDGEDTVHVALARNVHLTEHQLDYGRYATDTMWQAFRDQAIARWRGVPYSPPAVDEEQRAKDLSIAVAAEANRRTSTPSPRRVKVDRCPRCGSTDAGLAECIFENRKWACNRCGHFNFYDNYDSTEDWELVIELPAGIDDVPDYVAPLGASEPLPPELRPGRPASK